MSVSDEQARIAFRRGSSRLVLLAEVEFAYEAAGNPATGTIYLADRDYATEPTDTPASTPYRDVITAAPDFTRAIDLKTLGGRGSRAAGGTLELNNADGSLDFLLDVIMDGRDVRFYLGDASWARADFRLVGVAAIASVSGDDASVTLDLRDKNYLLDVSVIGDPMPSGPNEGKPKPIVLGLVKNFDVGPYLLDEANLVYCINNFELEANAFSLRISDVRDAGGSLDDGDLFNFTSGSMTADAGTNTLTHTTPHGLSENDVVHFLALIAGALFTGLSSNTQYWVIATGLTANDFRLSLTKGGAAVDITGTGMSGTWRLLRRRFYVDGPNATLQLSSPPAGRVTMDYAGVDAGGVLGVGNTSPHKAFKWLLQNYTQLAAEEYDEAALDALGGFTMAYGRAILDRVNLIDLLDEIAFCSTSWYGWGHDGVLTVGVLELYDLDAQTPIATIDGSDFDAVSVENLSLPWGRVVVDVDKNVVVQTDGLLDSIDAEDRSRWGQPHQTRITSTDIGSTTYDPSWWDYHKSATDSKPLALPLSNILSTVQTTADEMLEQFKPWTRVIRCSVGLDKYDLNPGDCVEITHPRYGMDDGVNARVISIRARVSDKACDLVLVRTSQPDFTTASHI